MTSVVVHATSRDSEHERSAKPMRRQAARERPQVLIVDDDPLVADMYRVRLEVAGYGVAIARHGEEGLSMASITTPAFICLDYRLPGMDGLEALRRLRAQPATQAIPVLMLSNDADPAIRERALRLGALDLGIKAEMAPAQLATFITQQLRQCTGERKSSRDPRRPNSARTRAVSS